LLDTDHVAIRGKTGKKSAVRLFLKDAETGETFYLFDYLEPYFYLLLEDGKEKETEDLKKKLMNLKAVERNGEVIRPTRVEEVKRLLLGKEKHFLKIFVCHPQHVPQLREHAKEFGKTFEYGITYAQRRYLIDRNLIPSSLVEIEFEGKFVKTIRNVEEKMDLFPELRRLAFDIEVYNPKGVPDASRDPVIMISYADSKESGVYSYEKDFGKKEEDFLKKFAGEKELIEAFCSLLRKKRVDLLYSYNGDVFDLPYLRDRSRKLKTRFRASRDLREPILRKHGIRGVVHVGGRIHLDVFNAVSFMDVIGALRMPRLSLDKVYAELMGKEKEDIKKLDIWKAWEKGGEELAHLAEYSRSDAVAAFHLGDYVLPLEIQLSKVSGTTLFDASRATTGQLIEALLMRRAYQLNEIIVNKPKESEIEFREGKPVEGAFVKIPAPGVYENIAVVDFRSLYPSIIISHNVDPATLNCDCCKKNPENTSPSGHWFCTKKRGILPQVLEEVLEARAKVKEKMKHLKKDSEEWKKLDARQWALKIMLNSAYGYLLYARSRWYSRECGESVTAWGRYYIHETERQAEEFGLKVLYMDTDSAFIQFGAGGEKEVSEFQHKFNEWLPEHMELELEGIYPRGIFVSKKQEEKGAKKKYALIDREGKIKIRGFELVRRDWSRIARHTQREVLEILLKEGNVKKAIELVRKKIIDLRDGKVPLQDCVIYTQLRKKVKSYEVSAPEITAFEEARKAGLPYEEGAVVGYVITTKGKSISDKARVIEMAEDYDADYYINHQVLPAVLKILGALGISEDDIKQKGTQTGLNGW
jgi:DNA polymerase I